MTKRFKLIALTLIIALVSLVFANVLSYAFFSIEMGSGNTDLSSDITDNGLNTDIVRVSSAAELSAAVTDGKNNPDAPVQDIRKTVLLESDIELVNNLRITKDVNIDFNGRTIFTSGRAFEIVHNYYGLVNLYNGSITGDAPGETLRVITPNAAAVIDVALTNISVDIRAVDADSVFNAASAFIADKIVGNRRSVDVDCTKLLNANRHCVRHASSGAYNNCAYVSDNIDLPIYFGNYGAEIEYSSSNTSVLSDNGNVTRSLTGVIDVTLTALISYGGSEKRIGYNLHVFDKANAKDAGEAAIIEASDRLEAYYYEGESEGASVALYRMPEPVSLNKKSIIGGAELIFTTFDAKGDIIDSTTDAKEENFSEIPDNEHLWSMTLTDEAAELQIGAVNTDMTVTLPVNGQNSQTINDNYAVAVKISRELYGNEIVITSESRDIELSNTAGKEYVNGYSSKRLKTDIGDYAKNKIKSISYNLINNVDFTYTLGGANDRLQVIGRAYPPTEIQNVNVRMRFEFETVNDGAAGIEIININIPVRYDLQEEGDGNNPEKFLPYYNYFDRLLNTRTNGYSYKSFEMPFGYGAKGAVYYFNVYNQDGTINNDILSMKLLYTLGQVNYEADVRDVENMAGDKIAEIMLSGTGKWRIDVNIDYVPKYDLPLKLRYLYKFYDFTSNYLGNDIRIYESDFIITGIIKPNSLSASNMSGDDSQCITDDNLYKYVYDCARPNKNTSEYISGNGEYIVTDWLDDKFTNASGESIVNLSGGTINDTASSSNGKSVNNYDGLRFLVNLDVLNLKKANVKVTDSVYLSEMLGLKSLDLSDNALYDRSKGSFNFPSGSNNNFLINLSTLANLEWLHLENNQFYYFTGIDKLPSLKRVCVFGNTFSGGSFAALNTLVNNLYGTNGVVNLSMFMKMVAGGVRVHDVDENTDYSMNGGDAELRKVIGQMNAIAYQRVLPEGAPVTQSYAGLSSDPRQYGIKNQSDTKKWPSSGQYEDSLAFAYDGDANTASSFRLVYTFTKSTSIWDVGNSNIQVSVEVEFEISRM